MAQQQGMPPSRVSARPRRELDFRMILSSAAGVKGRTLNHKENQSPSRRPAVGVA